MPKSEPVPEPRQQELIALAESRLGRVHALKPAHEIAFIVVKSENENTVVYQGKYKGEGAERALDNPAVEVYWIDFAKDPAGGAQAGLNLIERNTAYGMTVKPVDETTHSLVLAALKSKAIILRLDEAEGEERKIVGTTAVADVEAAQLTMVYVQMKEKAWVPGVQHIDIVGRNPASGEFVFERLIN
eukprot:Hpha_TRINITY_DN12787_c0_g1::TRINITY_DN12787_c0_g1_i3::g.114252::m.114252